MAFEFMSLPREIRDLVYSVLLTDELPQQASHKQLQRTTTIFGFWQLDTRFIHVPPYLEPSVQNLLASNSQIRHEIQAKLARPGARCEVKYHLDCLVVDGTDSELFPYWRVVPAPVPYMTPHMFQLDVRSTKDEDSPGRSRGHPTSLWKTSPFKVLELMEEFFNRGPTFRRVSEIRDDVKVQTVLINILKPEDLPKEAVDTPRKRGPRRLPDGSLHPLSMFEMLVGYVPSLKRTLRGRAKVLRICYEDTVSEHEVDKR